MPGSAISSRTELAVRSSLKSQLGRTSSPSAGPTLVSKRTPSRISPPTATPAMPVILRLAVARVHHRHVERAAAEIDRDLDTAVRLARR